MLAPVNYCFLYEELCFFVCLQPIKMLHSAPLSIVILQELQLLHFLVIFLVFFSLAHFLVSFSQYFNYMCVILMFSFDILYVDSLK